MWIDNQAIYDTNWPAWVEMKVQVKPREVAQFDFGANWKAFSEHGLTHTRIQQAKGDFSQLFSGIPLRDRAFLDIGFGQGLAICLAKEAGAEPFGIDINPKCIEALKSTARFFPDVDLSSIPVVIGSILDPSIVELLRMKSPDQGSGTYDIVHSWG